MANVEYVRIDKDALYNFRDVIYPNVWDELFVAESFEEVSAYGIGALMDGIPVGSVIFHEFPNYEIFISNLYVSEVVRHQGIGRELMENMLAQSWDIFETVPGIKENIVSFFVHTEYALPDEDKAVLDAFLKGVGFTDFADRKPVYLFESENIRKMCAGYVQDEDVTNLSVALGEDDEDVSDILNYRGMDVDTDNCFILGDKEEPDYLIMAEYSDGQDFMITSQTFSDTVKDDECLKAIKAVANKLSKEYENVAFLVSSDKNSNPELWDKLAGEFGEKIQRTEAGMYVLVS